MSSVSARNGEGDPEEEFIVQALSEDFSCCVALPQPFSPSSVTMANLSENGQCHP